MGSVSAVKVRGFREVVGVLCSGAEFKTANREHEHRCLLSLCPAGFVAKPSSALRRCRLPANKAASRSHEAHRGRGFGFPARGSKLF